MNKKTQYQQNFDILNKFYKKPINLITGIFAILTSFTFTIAVYYCSKNITLFLNKVGSIIKLLSPDMIINNFGTSFLPSIVINIFPLLFGLAFIMFCLFSDDNDNKLNSVSRFFKISSLILLIFSLFNICIVISVSIILLYLFPIKIILYITITALLISGFSFILNFSRLRFAKSIHRSVNSIYLNNKGATLFATFNIISAIFSLPFLFILISTYFINSSELFFSLLPLIVFFTVFTTEKLLWGITAIQYSKYIKGVIYGRIKVISDPPMSDFEMQLSNDYINNDEAKEVKKTVRIPKSEEKTLPFSNMIVSDIPESNFSFNITPKKSNDYLDNHPLPNDESINSKDPVVEFTSPFIEAPDITDVSFAPDIFLSAKKSETFACPDCGAPYTDEDYFCNVCGKKLI